jgi:hypothetical protein
VSLAGAPSKQHGRHTNINADVTYIASILSTSTDRKYLITNASWLAGAGLTIFLDLFILAQFAVYSYQDREAKVFADDSADHDA